MLGFAHHGKRLRQQRVERFALRKTLPEAVGFPAQLIIAQFGDIGFELVDGLYGSAILLDQAVITATKDTFQYTGNHVFILNYKNKG